MAVAASRMAYEPPMAPVASVPVVAGVDLVEDDGAGVVFLAGNAAWSWAAGDVGGRRLAAVGLVEVDAASQREVAAAFGVNETTLWRWRQAYAEAGAAGLAAASKGPRRASKLTADRVAEIAGLRAQGLSMETIAGRVGVSLNSVSRALKPAGDADAASAGAAVDVRSGEVSPSP